MKAERTVKRITFNPSEANPGETLYVSVPKLSENEVLVSGSLALVFNINLSGGHANNYLVQNVSRALVDKFHVKFAATTCPGHGMGTTSTRSSRTSSSQGRTSGPTCLARASRVRICAGFALALATRIPPAWMRKTS